MSQGLGDPQSGLAHSLPILLEHASDRAHYGNKAVRLGEALRAQLPVPGGVALPVAFVELVARAEPALGSQLESMLATSTVAVRSSATSEDGTGASFAGLHVTGLNVGSGLMLRAAIRAVHESGHGPAAQLYRQRLGIDGPVRIAALVQTMVAADTAGVLFTRDPVSGQRACLIEASWGLGEVVVSGRVNPDAFRLSPSGAIVSRRAGHKDVRLRFRAGGGVEEVAVPAAQVTALCLSDGQLAELYALAGRCQELFGPDLDLEWAFAGEQLYLLQCRPITRGCPRGCQ